MAETDVKICRLCLNVIESTNFEIVEAFRIEMIKTILVNIDLSITTDPIICCKCADVLQKCFDFKRTCLSTEDHVKSFVTNISEPTKVNLEDIYFKQFFESETCKRQKICRLCFKWDCVLYVSIDLENRSLEDLLKNCVPEVNLDLTNEPLVCQLCVDMLTTQFTFILDCLEIEEKIKMFCDLKRCNDSNFVDLNNIRHYFEGIITENCIETELSHFGNTPKLEEVFIKTEPDYGILKYEELNMPKNVEMKIECNSEDESISREEEEMSLSQHKEMQSNGTIEQEHFKSVNVNSEKKLRCPKCSFTAKYKSSIEDHMISHRNPSEITMFHCNLCPFETKREKTLKGHMIVHRDIPESEMFKCESCEFKCKRKSSLNQHMLLHNNSSESIFKCAQCNYLAKTQRYLTKHERIHKDISETFKCNDCDYQARWKRNLNRHMLRHNPSKVVYKCEKCDFSTKNPECFKKHDRIHKDESEVRIFKCNDCTYQSRWKESLKKHILTHIRKKMKNTDCYF